MYGRENQSRGEGQDFWAVVGVAILNTGVKLMLIAYQ